MFKKINKMMSHEKYMQRCLQLAKNGIGRTEPNPYVGAVIVYRNQIIGEGFHSKYGKNHAEVNAINSVKKKDLLKESVLYVNLEPCSHFGKTPPCTELIVNSGIRNVVIAIKDPNPLVAGAGINFLKKSGLNIKIGILEKEAESLNKRFITFHKKKRPYIILKWAKTLDNFVDIDRNCTNKSTNNWITGLELKTIVHRWRAQEQSILIGYNTLVNDNPRLNNREWYGNSPTKILLTNVLPEEKYNFFGSTKNSIVINPHKDDVSEKAEYIKINFDDKLLIKTLDILYNKNISSIIIEGGKQVLETFIYQGLWDEARVLIGNTKFHTGLLSPEISSEKLICQKNIGNEILQIYSNSKLCGG